MNKIPVYKSLFEIKLFLGVPHYVFAFIIALTIILIVIFRDFVALAPPLIILYFIRKKYKEDNQFFDILIKRITLSEKIG